MRRFQTVGRLNPRVIYHWDEVTTLTWDDGGQFKGSSDSYTPSLVDSLLADGRWVEVLPEVPPPVLADSEWIAA